MHNKGPWAPACGRPSHTLQLVRGAAAAKPPGAKLVLRQVYSLLKEGFDPITDEITVRSAQPAVDGFALTADMVRHAERLCLGLRLLFSQFSWGIAPT